MGDMEYKKSQGILFDYNGVLLEQSALYDGAAELLLKLSVRYKIGLVTGALRLHVEPLLRDANVYQYFDVIVTAEDVQRGKPYPDGYKKGAEGLGLPANAIIAVEDTPAGVHAAKAAGLGCVAIEGSVSADALTEADEILAHTIDLSPEVITRIIKSRQNV